MLRLALFAILQLWLINYSYGVVPQITRLNVQCDRAGMKVVVDFDIPFNGIIFSKGHFNDPNCRFVQPNSSSTLTEFLIPVERCGTSVVEIDAEDGSAPKRGFENIVVFQNDPTYQEVWDHARMIVCRYSITDDFDLKEKRIVFKPVVVDMLDVIRIPIQDETGEQTRVDCWMEITRGRFPQNNAIDGPVKVGSPLTLAIFIRDPRKRTDVRVKDCYAYDDPEVAENNGPALLQLTDFDGCPTKPKLIEVWKRTLDTGPTGATVIAFSTVTAFKFPDRADLQLTCNIELCRTQCATRCSAELPDPVVIGPWNREIEDGDTAGAGAGPSTTPPAPTGSPITPQTSIETEEEEETEESGEEGEEPTTTTTTTTTTEATATAESEAPPEGDGEEEEEEEEASEEEATSPATAATTPSSTTEAEAGEDEEEEEANGESANGGETSTPGETDSGSSNGETDSGEDTESETGGESESDNEAENESDDESEESQASPATTPSTTTSTTTAAATEATTSESADEDAADDEEEEADEESNEDDGEESESSAKLKQTATVNINTKTKSKAVTTPAPKTTKKSKSKTSQATKQPAKASAAIVKSETRTNLIEQIHWSTTTLRPLKELMNQKSKSKSVNILTSKKAPQSRSTTTTAPPKLKSKKTTTTTTTSTTTPSTTTTTTTTKAPSTTTTTTKATTTTTTRATTTTKKSARRASAKKSSKAKTSTTTTERSSTQPALRRARAPSSSHPDEFPNLHIVEDRKRFLATRRPPIFRFKSLSLIKASSTVPPPVYENQLSTNAEHLTPENLTRVTLTPAFFRQRMPSRFQYRGRHAPNVTDQQTTTTTTTELPKPDLSELRRPPLRNEDILDDRVSDNRPFYTFHFQPQRIRKPINRVVRSVTMSSNVIKTRVNSGIFVI